MQITSQNNTDKEQYLSTTKKSCRELKSRPLFQVIWTFHKPILLNLPGYQPKHSVNTCLFALLRDHWN